jgi:prophage regulatory protein
MKFLKFRDLKPRGITWSRVHVDRMEKKGRFPRRIHIGPGTTAWLEHEIDAWLQARIDARDQDAG